MFTKPSSPSLGISFFYTRQCQQTCSYYASRFAAILPECENSATKEKVIDENLQRLEVIGMTTIPIINASGEVVHCKFLVQKRGFTVPGIRTMRELGVTISLIMDEAEVQLPKLIAKNILLCENASGDMKTANPIQSL